MKWGRTESLTIKHYPVGQLDKKVVLKVVKAGVPNTFIEIDETFEMYLDYIHSA